MFSTDDEQVYQTVEDIIRAIAEAEYEFMKEYHIYSSIDNTSQNNFQELATLE